ISVTNCHAHISKSSSSTDFPYAKVRILPTLTPITKKVSLETQ
ncbi:3000_t:CDS:1, partial [Paraglomus occultum]